MAAFVAALLILTAKAKAAEGPATPVADVVLHSDGTLHGRVIGATAQQRVIFVRGEVLVAATATTPHGRFQVPELGDGLYRVIVEQPADFRAHYCRVWSPRRAPPVAATELHLPPTAPIVRGKPPASLRVKSLRQAAVWAGIVGGAVAAPVIYRSTLVENRLPASR
jgi:hypothetical protein